MTDPAILTAIPHLLRPGFLGEALAGQILNMALARHQDMRPSIVGHGSRARQDPKVRQSLELPDLGDTKAALREHVMAALPGLFADLGIPVLSPSQIEISLTAHGDGAFYRRHIDTQTGPDRAGKPRRLSLVLHLFRQSRGFDGGALRLYAIQGTRWIDIEPEHDRLVVFPSWLPHEVLPVSIPDDRFEAWRFAINFWVRG